MGGIAPDDLDAALARLVVAERIMVGQENSAVHYSATSFLVSLGDEAGFEASVFDHFQSVVKTITCRLRRERTPLEPPAGCDEKDLLGGSTYTFDLWPGHPFATEVLVTLRDYRERMSGLRRKIEDYNARNGVPVSFVKVLSYAGQCLIQDEGEPEAAQ